MGFTVHQLIAIVVVGGADPGGSLQEQGNVEGDGTGIRESRKWVGLGNVELTRTRNTVAAAAAIGVAPFTAVCPVAAHVTA